jgi:hypothetical protein
MMHLIRQWPILVAALSLGAVTGLLMAKAQTPRHVATMLISSVGPEDTALSLGPSIGGGSGVLQALRGITGSAGAAGNTDFNYFIALMRSDRMASQLVKDDAVLQHLFPREWNTATRSWQRPDGLLQSIKASYLRFFFGMHYVPPDIERTKERLNEVFVSQLDIETGSYLLSVKDRQCAVAISLLGSIFSTTDRVLKNEKRIRFSENINSLRAELGQLENAELRSQIASALLAQYLRKIAAESRLPLAARVLDGPGCPPRPVLPVPLSYAAAGAIAAFALVLGWLAARQWRRNAVVPVQVLGL